MSADSENKEESQTMRQNLVDEAVKFLVNPNVARHAVDQKSSFLRKKGLSENEIQEAFVRAKAAMPLVAATSGPLVQPGPQVGVPVPAYPMLPPPSIWIQVRDVCNFILIISGASYGAYHLFKNYIGPLLTGRKQKSVEESMIELQHSVVSVLKEVQTTLASLEQSLSVQNVRIQNLSAKEERNHTASQQLEEIKTEITSLKGLLINRRTFPSTPSMSPSIPSWQRTKTTEKNLEEPAISDASVPTQQDEITKPEGTQAKIRKEEAGELITDGISGESGVDINDGNEEDSNPSSAGENVNSAGESLSLVESLGESSDEMSQ